MRKVHYYVGNISGWSVSVCGLNPEKCYFELSKEQITCKKCLKWIKNNK